MVLKRQSDVKKKKGEGRREKGRKVTPAPSPFTLLFFLSVSYLCVSVSLCSILVRQDAAITK